MAVDEARDLVVIGGSAGALPVLRAILPELPRNLAASILVVLHTSRGRPGALAMLLGRLSPLPVRFAEDGEPLQTGEILLAPPDHHLIVEGSSARTTRGPREGGFRPAIDPLFRTAAETYGRRVVGVVLSGALDDGALGLQCIKRAGGFAIVQAPDDATFPSMPLAALREVEIDAVLPASKIAGCLIEAAGTAPARPLQAPDLPLPQRDTAEVGRAGLRDRTSSGPPSAFTCPECGGALWEERRGRSVGFRCHVGHAYGEASLIAHQSDKLEGALWTALRTLEEAVALRRRMAEHAIETGLDALALAYLDGAAEAEKKADAIREVLTTPSLLPGDESERGMVEEPSAAAVPADRKNA